MSGLKAAIVPVTPFQQNCTILYDETIKRGAVVDPGGDIERIVGFIAERGIEVERILLTHGHVDHAGGAAALKATLELGLRPFGAPPVSVPIEGPHEADRFLLEELEEQGRIFGIPGARSVVPDRFLEEGDVVRIADYEIQVLHCPGHTPGHIVFYAQAPKILVAGDVLFKDSIGRADFPYSDEKALNRALREKIGPLPDDVTVLCGHGDETKIGDARKNNPYFRNALQGEPT
ncbi:MAG: MBL fold metallo-hydrolase [Geminicoccaceae bacterium]|nr:MBL fold metallo-hydrolase [Geminicoccaceae bacterium]